MYDLVMKYAREEDLKVIKEYLAERESVESRQNIMAPRTPRAVCICSESTILRNIDDDPYSRDPRLTSLMWTLT